MSDGSRGWYAEWDEVDGERFFVVGDSCASGGYGVAWIPEDEVGHLRELLDRKATNQARQDIKYAIDQLLQMMEATDLSRQEIAQAAKDYAEEIAQ